MNKKMNEHLINQCLKLIKCKLKEKNKTYVDVANIFSVSENTVKRMLNAKDIDFGRLLMLAELCEIKLDNLLEEATKHPTPYNYFTPQQDEAFFSNA